MNVRSSGSKTFVLARTRWQAIVWCQRNGVSPYSRDTYLASTDAGLRGLELRDGDRLVWATFNEALVPTVTVLVTMADARGVRYTVVEHAS